MPTFPSLNVFAVLLGAVLSFGWGGLHFGVGSARVAGADAESHPMPPAAGDRIRDPAGAVLVASIESPCLRAILTARG